MDDGDVAFDDMLEEEGDWFVQTEDGPFVEPPAEGDVPMGGSEMAVDSENVVVSGGAASSSAVAGGAVSSSAVAEVDGVVAVAGEPVAGAIAVAADGAGEPVEMDERTPERIMPVVCPPVTPQRPIARRLFRKTRVQPVEARVLPIRPGASADVKRGDAVDMWQHLTLDAFAKMEPRARYFKVFNKFRWWCARLRETSHDAGTMEDQPAKVQRMFRVYKNFRSSSPEEKRKALLFWALTAQAPRHIVEFIEAQYPEMAPDAGGGFYLYARSVLFTWQGSWGLFTSAGVDPGASWRQVVLALLQNSDFQALWSSFREFISKLADLLDAPTAAAAMELCVESWTNDNVCRVHGHGYFSSDSQKLKLSRGALAAFRGGLPHKSHKVQALGNRACSGWAGCYYVLAPKIGQVRSWSMVRPYKDFPVSPEWIMGLVHAEKMEFKDALEEMARCGKGYVRRVHDLKAWRNAKNELALQARVQAEQEWHRAHNLEFHSFPMIESWMRRNMQPHMRRKQFLVVEGPSGVGKTEYLRSLVGPEEVLELNADGMRTPFLGNFDAAVHKVVFWDECLVQLVLDSRKLFQCPPAWITLGLSPTGRDAYRVWLNDCVMVIGSNSWSEQLAQLKRPSDEEWIRANQVHIIVTSKMFKEA